MFHRTILRSLRILYTLPFILAVSSGGIPAIIARIQKTAPTVSTASGAAETPFSIFGIILVESFLFAIFVNLNNDLADHASGVDRLRFDITSQEHQLIYSRGHLPKMLYWEGNPFDLGIITVRTSRIILGITILMLVLLLVPLLFLTGVQGLLCGAAALLFGYAYSGPPFRLDCRGYGEIVTGGGFGALSFCSAWLTAGPDYPPSFLISALIVAMAVGLGAYLMRGIDGLTGYRAHREAGERDMGVRLGPSGAARRISWILFAPPLLLVFFMLISLLTHPRPLFGSFTVVSAAGVLVLLGFALPIHRLIRKETSRGSESPGWFVPVVVPALRYYGIITLLFTISSALEITGRL